MDDDAHELTRILDLEQIELDMFRGFSPPREHRRIYGGQVVAQAPGAAYRTIEHRVCASLHAYFIPPGDPSIPLLYMAQRARDRRRLTVPPAVALPNRAQIFHL